MNDQKNVPVRCKEDDPNRCQGMTKRGQCPFLAMPDHKHCVIHGRVQENTSLYNFERTEVLARLSVFRGHTDSRTLATELGVLRLLLEQIINKCGEYELLQNSVQIASIIDKIKDLQLANTKLEERVGDLLSVEQVIEVAQQLYGSVVTHLKICQIIQSFLER